MTWAPCPHGVRTRGKKHELGILPAKAFFSIARLRLTIVKLPSSVVAVENAAF